jgi:hypothetical protein
MGFFRSPVPLSGLSSKKKLNRDSLILSNGTGNGAPPLPLDDGLLRDGPPSPPSSATTKNNDHNEKVTGTISNNKAVVATAVSKTNTKQSAPSNNNNCNNNYNSGSVDFAPPMFHTLNDHDRQLLKNLKGTFLPSPPGTIRRGSYSNWNSVDPSNGSGLPLVSTTTIGDDHHDGSAGLINNNNNKSRGMLSSSKGGNNNKKNKNVGNYNLFNQSFSVGVQPSNNVRMKGPLPSSDCDDGSSSAANTTTNSKSGTSKVGRGSVTRCSPRRFGRGSSSSVDGSTNSPTKRRSSAGSGCGLNNSDGSLDASVLLVATATGAALPLSPTKSTTSLGSVRDRQSASSVQGGVDIEEVALPPLSFSAPATSHLDIHNNTDNNPQSLASDSYSYIEELIEDDDDDDHISLDDGDRHDDDNKNNSNKGSVFVGSSTVSGDEFIEEIILEDEESCDGAGFLHGNGPTNIVLLCNGEALKCGRVDGLDPSSMTSITRRSVRFDEFDEVQMTLHMHDYTKQEVKQSWYKREDYDGMIQLSRALVQKEEARRTQEQLQQQQKQEERQNDTMALASAASTDQLQQHQDLSSLPPSPSTSMLWAALSTDLDTRGLESWSTTASQHVRQMKEAAVEAVWNEQHRQWEAGIQDYETLRMAYQKVSTVSQKIAQERGMSDQKIAERIQQLEELERSSEAVLNRTHKRRQQMQQHRRSSINSSILLLVRSKSILNKSVKAAGKVARETGKRGAKAGVGAFTLDPRMLLESIKIEKKKREAKASKERQIFKQPSAAGLLSALEGEGEYNVGWPCPLCMQL